MINLAETKQEENLFDELNDEFANFGSKDAEEVAEMQNEINRINFFIKNANKLSYGEYNKFISGIEDKFNELKNAKSFDERYNIIQYIYNYFNDYKTTIIDLDFKSLEIYTKYDNIYNQMRNSFTLEFLFDECKYERFNNINKIKIKADYEINKFYHNLEANQNFYFYNPAVLVTAVNKNVNQDNQIKNSIFWYYFTKHFNKNKKNIKDEIILLTEFCNHITNREKEIDNREYYQNELYKSINSFIEMIENNSNN